MFQAFQRGATWPFFGTLWPKQNNPVIWVRHNGENKHLATPLPFGYVSNGPFPNIFDTKSLLLLLFLYFGFLFRFQLRQFGHVLQTAFGGMFCRCGSKWQCDFTHNRKQVVNRLKIPQGLPTSLFHRWSEVPSRGGVRGDSPYEKLPALQRCHLSVFSECCFLRLLARLSTVKTSSWWFCSFYNFVGLCSSQSGSCRAPFKCDWFILRLFVWPSSI